MFTEIMDLFHNVKLTKVAIATVSNQTDVEATPVDMLGYEGAVFFGAIGTANAGNYLKIRQGTDSTVSDAADLEGTKVVAASNASIVWCDIYKPLERFLQAFIEKGGAATTTGDIYCLQYGGRKGLETNLSTGVIIGERHISPAEGTA